ncbi:DNA binding protein [Umboniibacter marinipuniceus]|uniref:MvaT DNA-binding domain-containing protein n=1 Tax=Umboniibacter marinipuniceus TaxID=569599 RepID=A0A3M0A5L8_9GAMM|nr:DNA binding protein [Umboniibacter marinipuniceus]RMA80070.1 hypothetical protein DFR27_1426 [Umboniibacter marinipuniceus]
MGLLNIDIDKEIQAHKKQLEKLEALKQAQADKLQGIEEFGNVMKRLAADYGLSEVDLLSAKGDKFLSVVKAAAKQKNPPKYLAKLAAFFADNPQLKAAITKPSAKLKKSAKKKRVSDEPKVPVGRYKNPHTGEVVEKLKRAPKVLKDWSKQYGDETLMSWKI